MNDPTPPRVLRDRRLRRALEQAASQEGVLSVSQLRELGVTRGQIRAQIAACRWQRVHPRVVAVQTGALTERGQWWAAVLHAGPAAYLDGVTALLAEGLTGFSWDTICVSVPPRSRVQPPPGIDLRPTRRHHADDVVPHGLPRARREIACVRAALWARSDKQAVLVLTMCVQQGLTTPERIGQELLRVRRDRRRLLLHATVLDLLDGVRSMGEAEFAAQCRVRGLPPPTRQVVRTGKGGRAYLDACWEEWGVVVEIDGIHHTYATEVVGDALRQNQVSMGNELVLRLPLLGLRVAADEFFAQIEEALRARGCPLVSERAS